MEGLDFIGKEGGEGKVANYISTNGLNPYRMRPFIAEDGKAYINVNVGGKTQVQLVNNATLRREEWLQLDQTIVPLAESRLQGIADLEANGLVYNLGNPMGTTVIESHTISDAMEAELTMDGISRSKNDRIKYGTNYLPIPIIHSDYEINSRVLAASRSLGNPLDTSSAERAARVVAQKIENLLFTATTYTFGGGTIYSYLNHPSRNTGSLTATWTSATAAQIITDVQNMLTSARNDHFYGPFMLYIPATFETKLDSDYSTSGTSVLTIRERIMKFDAIKGIKVVDTLPTNNVVLVQMTPDVVRLVKGLPIKNVQWKSEGEFITNFKVLTIQVPQIRADYDGRSGVQHYSV